MDLDSIISSIEGKPAAKTTAGTIDVDSILKEFGIKDEPVKIEAPKKVAPVNTEPRPPISGISKEASDEINATRSKKGLPTEEFSLTSPAAYEHHKAGKEMFSSGVEDLTSGHPYKGLAKAALGGLMVVGAPASGIIDDTVGKYGNKLGPGFGDRAALITGGALPVVPGTGAVIKALPKTKSLRTLVENIGPENLPMVVKEMKANPRLAPADLSPRVLQDTQHLFANDGPQINYLKNTSDARMATRKSATEEAYDASAGVSPNLAQKMTDLANAAKKIGSDKIQPALDAAKPVDISNTLSVLDATLKPGVLKIGDSVPLTEVKKQLVNIRNDLRTSKEFDAKDLHKFQSGLRETAERLLKSTSGTDVNVGKALMDVRANLVSDIDKSAKGYKDALHSYRDEMHIAEAFKEGHDKILTSSKKIENDPSFVKKWFDGLTDHEQQAVKEGVRTAIYTEMGVAKNPALAGESIMRSDFNKAKMEIILGKEEASKLFKALEDERKIANTHNKVVENSQTAMRNASKAQFAMPTKTDAVKAAIPVAIAEGGNAIAGGYPLLPTLALGGLKVGSSVKDAIKTKLAREHNAQYAKLALPTEGPSRDELIRALEAAIPKPKLSLMSRARLALPTP